MALPLHALKLIKPFIKGDVLSLGYPDLQVTSSEMEGLFGYKPAKFNNTNEWHGNKDPFPDTQEFFDRIGARLTVVDYVQERGIEVVADLNEPHDLGKFDLVIDPGSLEHCFNIGQAMMNAANAVRAGGRLFHLSPMNMLNHGFYNICPTFFYDFYTQNDWAIEGLVPVKVSDMQFQATKRFINFSEHILSVLAMRRTDDPLKYPIQHKYKVKHG